MILLRCVDTRIYRNTLGTFYFIFCFLLYSWTTMTQHLKRQSAVKVQQLRRWKKLQQPKQHRGMCRVKCRQKGAYHRGHICPVLHFNAYFFFIYVFSDRDLHPADRATDEQASSLFNCKPLEETYLDKMSKAGVTAWHRFSDRCALTL